MGALLTTPTGAPMRESGLTPAPVALDTRKQQCFAARLADVCEGSNLEEQHDYPTSGTPICRVVKKEHNAAGQQKPCAGRPLGRSQRSRL